MPLQAGLKRSTGLCTVFPIAPEAGWSCCATCAGKATRRKLPAPRSTGVTNSATSMTGHLPFLSCGTGFDSVRPAADGFVPNSEREESDPRTRMPQSTRHSGSFGSANTIYWYGRPLVEPGPSSRLTGQERAGACRGTSFDADSREPMSDRLSTNFFPNLTNPDLGPINRSRSIVSAEVSAHITGLRTIGHRRLTNPKDAKRTL